MSTDALAQGTRLQEYRVDAVLGAGAFAITYKAWDENLKLPVAIKEYFPGELMAREDDGSARPKTVADAELCEWGLARFVSEAQVLAQFKHPNIVRVARYFTANRTAYIVMDYERGESLSDFLARSPGAQSEAFVRNLFVPLLEGLKVVHGKRYLHRDIKPGNIYLREDGSPLLLDFGAARLEFGAVDADSTAVLTPRYAPPEQYRPDGEQGPWSDLYALGATMYRCITGDAPLEAPRRARALEHDFPDPHRPARVLGDGHFSAELLDAVDWSLQVATRDRPQSAAALLARLTGASQPNAGNAGTFAYVPRRAIRTHKIVFCGPVGAGKTTAIAALSSAPIVRTDEQATDMTRARKDTTTVAMDFGVIDLSESERIHLYGTPGQERFDFMWDILKKGALGVVLLLDNSRRAPLEDLDFYLDAFGDLIGRTAVAIGVNFMERAPQPSLDDYHRHLAERDAQRRINPPLFEVDPRNPADVGLLVEALLATLDPGVENYHV